MFMGRGFHCYVKKADGSAGSSHLGSPIVGNRHMTKILRETSSALLGRYQVHVNSYSILPHTLW